MLNVVLSAFLLGAVVCDVASHRLPNWLLLLGLLGALALQVWLNGLPGLGLWATGLLTGLLLLMPFYVMGGMAAGDVKLMAVAGSYLGAVAALWATAFTLLVGSLCGILYLLYKGQLGRLLGRYVAMVGLREYIPAQKDDAARHRFPYAIAIAAGTLLSLYWKPI